LFYPDSRAFFDGVTGPYYPAGDISPIWNPEFFGNTMMVNGRTWPFLETERRRYRFRLLNGCNSRTLDLDFSAIPGVKVWQIGNDGGLLPAVLDVTGSRLNRVLLAPAERVDLVVDFTAVPLGQWTLRNVGPDAPFSGAGDDPADPATTGMVMQFKVVPIVGTDPSTPGEFLDLPSLPALPQSKRTRRLALLESMSAQFPDSPAAALLGVVTGDPAAAAGATAMSQEWADAVSENPAAGEAEVWEFYNLTADAHPIHVHEVAFTVLNRQDIVVDDAAPPPAGGHGVMTGTIRLAPASAPVPPEPGERGRKDTVLAYPGQVLRIHAHFRVPGQFVWHCHIVEHEDNEMMRPYRVGPIQPGQPMPMP
jgi:FtsP/CotA-like multicopper oxidase with cupredoxin domain